MVVGAGANSTKRSISAAPLAPSASDQLPPTKLTVTVTPAEPLAATASLNAWVSGEVLSILRRSVDEMGQTVVIVTHDPRAASTADRVVFLADGRIAGEMADPTAESVLDAMKSMDR